MTTRKIEKKDWAPFFDGVSKLGNFNGKYADIEVSGAQLGNQIAAKSLPLLGVVYNIKGDILEIALESLDHLIRHPTEIFVDELATALVSISVTDGDGLRHIIRLI
ncbi:MAG: DUF5335 family protein [Burkholderiales bacterium]